VNLAKPRAKEFEGLKLPPAKSVASGKTMTLRGTLVDVVVNVASNEPSELSLAKLIYEPLIEKSSGPPTTIFPSA